MINHPSLRHLQRPGGMFDVEPCEMDLLIGHRGRRINPDLEIYGTISVQPFTVIGVQKNHAGKKCWRIVYDGDQQGFGCVLDPDEPVEWLEERWRGWICPKCQHTVLSKGQPTPIKWTDGHVCVFVPDPKHPPV